MTNLFKKRTLAYIADYFVVMAVMWIIAELLVVVVFPFGAFFIYEYLIILAPFVGMIYFVLLEKNLGTTVGKHLLFIKVVSNSKKNYYSNISYVQAIIRNLSKIYWFPIIIDVIIGRIFGSSNERILGRISRTEVINEDIKSDKK
ncbi:RDD family protein [Methanobrevibacter sp. TMH8]|uniref:RDD family protein n=1 Tax=Methanobrevibacter sp. TMH8 TaxID=2848611 RepID=UPI001CCC7DBA|nr:RDD family protein [Methanobrevibacter sp. TMH8]MBZ9570675.1 RDD family protein [Methanobrevibacter sp. TMH8]